MGKNDSKRIKIVICSVIISVLICTIFLLVIGISPYEVFDKLFVNSFENLKSISYCMVFAVPYIVTGLSVIFAYKANIFNIGAEGQYVVGCVAALVVSIVGEKLPSFVLLPLCMIASMVAGALWGLIIAFLKIKFAIYEIISMIMFNWIALYLSNFIVELPMFSAGAGSEASKGIPQNAMALFLPKDMIKTMGVCAITNWGIVIAIILAVIVYIVIKKTTFGYEIKAVGLNKTAAYAAGINVNKTMFLTLAISGALAGFAGSLHLLGMSKRVSVYVAQEGFGFGGIVVALMGAINPLGALIAGFFYGMLQYSGRSLNLLYIPTQVVDILTGIMIFFAGSVQMFDDLFNKVNIKEIKKNV